MSIARRVVFRWIQLSSLSAVLYGLTACGSNGSVPTPPVTGPPDVYAAGWDVVGTLFKAVYWKNGTENILDSGSYGARAEGIAVANGNVYVVGFEGSGSGNNVAVLWTNGVPTQLTSTSHLSIAWAIVLSGSDVYIAGSDATTPTTATAAVYWKDGVETTLGLSGVGASSTALGATANAIALDSSNNVYVGGQVYTNTETSPNNFLETNVASYWKDGTLTLLASPLTFSVSNGITVSDGNVYVVGTLCATPPAGTAPQPGCNAATYWENGSAVMQTSTSNSSYSGIAISGSDLYLPENVAVSGFLSSGNLAELSSNGTLAALSTNTSAAANCAFSYNGDVYVGGGANNIAGYWKNGTLVALPESGTQSDVTAIDVVPAGTAAP